MRKRSDTAAVSATPLATSLIVAEFDIDTGACLRACYPRPPASPSMSSPSSSVELRAPSGIAGHTEYFANVMLPDGAEKVNLTRTVFVVNRPQIPSYTRFPVYRFTRVSVTADRGDMQFLWERRPGEDTALYVPEILIINVTTGEVSLRYKGAEIEGPSAVEAENISSLPSIPTEVVRFSKQLEAMQRNEATLATSDSASIAAGVDSSIMDPGAAVMSSMGGRGGSLASGSEAVAASATTGAGVGGNHDGDYVFVVMHYTAAVAARQEEGYLMKESHFENFLKTLMTLVQREQTAAAAVASAASVPSQVDNSGGTPTAGAIPSIPTPLRRSGSLGSSDSASREARPESSTSSSFTAKAHHCGHPHDIYDHCPVTPGSRVSPVSPEPHSAHGGRDADTRQVTNSWEPSGHLMLPRADSMDSDAGVSATDKAVEEYHVDPSSAGDYASVTTQKSHQGAPTEAVGPVLFGLCAVVSKRDSTARRGGVTKSVAILGQSLVWLEPFFPVLVAAAELCCSVNGTDESALREQQRILKRCYDSVNNAAVVVAAGRSKVDQLTAEIRKHCTIDSGHQAYVHYSYAPFGKTIHAKIPLSPESNDIVFTRYSLEGLITTLGPSSLQLLLGILTEKKILILSRKGEAADVCEAAISLGIIGNLLDRNFMAQKVFPYVSVSSVDYFLGVPGYIVGTLNPIFETVNPWGWDLLCDLDKKSVVTAAERLQRKTTILSSSVGGNWAAATAGLANAVGVGGDSEALRSLPPPWQQLYKQLVGTIYHLRALRIGAVERNQRLRLMVEDFLFTVVVVGYVSGSNVSVPSALYPTFAHRSLAALRAEMALTSMMDSVRSHVLHPGENPALLLQCVALRHCACGETPVHRTLQALLALLNTAYDVKLFLRRMVLAVGGLNAVGMQLTSPFAEVRAAAAALLRRVELVPEGNAAIASMNSFFLMIYERSMDRARR
ncbi:hypothetical protein JKF63_03061 [Porcisia hertigi]|uniref:Arf3-interacting protein 1 N-terminal domain-containing protein n=1 Tax=Porcisia hertigi TaxID=2761500 RepID=A0A836LFY5_9TRYP|nr:hypothetical protein JKF63_03061 [Porcisia hertigi]